MLFLPLTPERNIISVDYGLNAKTLELPISDIVFKKPVGWSVPGLINDYATSTLRPEEVIALYLNRAGVASTSPIFKKIEKLRKLISVSFGANSCGVARFSLYKENDNEVYLPFIIDEVVPKNLPSFDYHVYGSYTMEQEQLEILGRDLARFNSYLEVLSTNIESIVDEINQDYSTTQFDFLVDNKGFEIDWNYLLCHFRLDPQLESDIDYWVDYIHTSRDIYKYSHTQNVLQESLEKIVFAPTLKSLGRVYILCECCVDTNSIDVVSVEKEELCLTQDPAKAAAIFASFTAASSMIPSVYRETSNPLFAAQYKDGVLCSIQSVAKEARQQYIDTKSEEYKNLLVRVSSALDKVLLDCVALPKSKVNHDSAIAPTFNKKHKI